MSRGQLARTRTNFRQMRLRGGRRRERAWRAEFAPRVVAILAGSPNSPYLGSLAWIRRQVWLDASGLGPAFDEAAAIAQLPSTRDYEVLRWQCRYIRDHTKPSRAMQVWPNPLLPPSATRPWTLPGDVFDHSAWMSLTNTEQAGETDHG